MRRVRSSRRPAVTPMARWWPCCSSKLAVSEALGLAWGDVDLDAATASFVAHASTSITRGRRSVQRRPPARWVIISSCRRLWNCCDDGAHSRPLIGSRPKSRGPERSTKAVLVDLGVHDTDGWPADSSVDHEAPQRSGRDGRYRRDEARHPHRPPLGRDRELYAEAGESIRGDRAIRRARIGRSQLRATLRDLGNRPQRFAERAARFARSGRK